MTQIQSAAPQVKKMAVVRKMQKPPTDRMALSTTEGYVIVLFADILYCEAMSNYCRIHLRTQQSQVVSKPLKLLQSVLPSTEFIRTHQSYLVRFDAITCAGRDITLTNGATIPLSRSRRSILGDFLRKRMPIV
jgi:two-component system LytT family response regulator